MILPLDNVDLWTTRLYFISFLLSFCLFNWNWLKEAEDLFCHYLLMGQSFQGLANSWLTDNLSFWVMHLGIELSKLLQWKSSICWNRYSFLAAILPEILPFTKRGDSYFMDCKWQTMKQFFSHLKDLKGKLVRLLVHYSQYAIEKGCGRVVKRTGLKATWISASYTCSQCDLRRPQLWVLFFSSVK